MTDSTPPERVRFADMPLSPEAQAGIQALGYEFATPVQAEVFERAMAGQDLMVQSKTGTGKTTAFGLPVIERIQPSDEVEPQALIMCPTRELANQVSEELAQLGKPKGVRVLPIYGGAAMGPQLKGLETGCDVVVGTPGRIFDHIRRRTLRLERAHTAVLDEADEMLSMGFWEDVTAILDKIPKSRQTLLFSATLPDQIRKTAKSAMREPELVDISQDELTVEGILNIAYEADDRLPKPRNLLYILEIEQPESAVIFCNTRDDTSIVAAFLRRQGLHALALSGELGQRDRERVMRRMKTGELQFLVATDIAARGIDISDLSHVVNYSLPDFTEVYLHRVGRTGRAGKSGTAISLVSGRDQVTKTALTRDFGVQFEDRELPEFQEIVKRQAERVALELQREARNTEVTSFLRLAKLMLETEPVVEAVAFLLRQHFSLLEEARAQEPLELGGEERAAEEARFGSDGGRGEPKPRRPDDKKDRKRGSRDRDRDRGRDRGADRERGERRERRGDGDGGRLFVNRGSEHGYDEEQLRSLVAEATGDPEGVGRINLRRTYSFVDVRPELAEKAVKAATDGLQREDKPVNIEIARSRG